MNKKLLFWIGILAVTLFTVASIIGGFQFDNYSPISQFISETMATGTPYGKFLRFFGYIPSGILIAIFSFNAISKFPKSNLTKIGFLGLGIFYGITTIIVGIFPCDKGCNNEFTDPSISQVIHNITGLLTYIFVPISILIISLGLRKWKCYHGLSKIGIICGLVSTILISYLIFDTDTNYAGLIQRIIEGIFIMWIITCSVYIKIDFK